MEGTPYVTKEAILKRAQEAIGIPLRDIDATGRLANGKDKGSIGTVLEESWFCYEPNGEARADFPEAGVELKVTPYLRTAAGIRAKERLVCNIINYMTEYEKTFKTSDFWHKCETMLIMSYEHKHGVPKGDFTIDKAVLFSFPLEDLIIIEQDWEKIMRKVRAGQAHLITEGDTLYLAACTKGATAASVRKQPFSDIPAKQRAYSLKSSYMTRILNQYIFGKDEDEHIIKDWRALRKCATDEHIVEQPITEENALHLVAYTKDEAVASVRKQPFNGIPAEQQGYSLNPVCEGRALSSNDGDERIIKDWRVLQERSFEDYIIEQLTPYYGMTQSELKNQFDVNTTAKSLNYILVARMLGINGDIRNTHEFQNANIIPKTIRIQKNGTIKESMSFPTFKFTEIIHEEWEDSGLREYIEPAKFLFIIFKEREDGQFVFERIKFWNIPAEDLEEVKTVWERTVQTIKDGVQLERVNNEVRNNLPKSTENRVAHVRPHARNASDTYPLPDGREMTKQCFWFNRSYIKQIVDGR